MRTLNLRNSSLMTGVCGGLVLGIPMLSSTALAAPNPRLNPCPKIYYEEPYNRRLIVPQNCPPNAITQLVRQNPSALSGRAGGIGSDLPGRNLIPDRIAPTPATVGQRPTIFNEAPYNRNPPGTATTLPVKPPLPEQRSQPVANVVPTNGTINVRLKNNTNAVVTYEAIQYTQRRTLAPGEETVLQNLPVPVTVTFVRQDNGFVEVAPIATPERGVLSLQLDEDATPLDANQGVVRVQRDGQVFLN